MTASARPYRGRNAGHRSITGRVAAVLVLVGLATLVPRAPRPGAAPARSDVVEPDKPLDQPGAAARFFMEQRLSADQADYPMEHVHDVLLGVRARERAGVGDGDGRFGGGSAPTWSELGPGNVGGRTRAIVIDPDEPDTMYAAGVAGGVWKSTDAGASWQSLDDFMLNLAVSTIAMDPTDPDVLYAGTGEGFAQGTSTYRRGLGIFKSVDAGETWQSLPATRNTAFYYVNKIVISPNDPSRIYAGTRFGVYRSLNGGQSWSVVLANPRYVQVGQQSNGSGLGCTDLAIRSDREPDVIFAAFGSFEADGLFRSDNGGNTWLGYGVPPNQGRMSLAIAPSDNDVLYILMADNGSGGQVGKLVNVYRTTDGGATFEGRVDFGTRMGPWLLSNLSLATGCRKGFPVYSQGWHDNLLAIDPADPDIVWVGGVDIFRSDDGGTNWGIAGYWFFLFDNEQQPDELHPDHHVIAFHPDYDGTTNQIMYAGSDGGLYRTANARAATGEEDCPFPADESTPEIVWDSVNNSYGVTQFYHGDSARDIDMFVGGAQDNGTSRGLARDTPNEWRVIFGGDGGYAAIDPRDNQTVYVSYQFLANFFKSIDGGETFVDATNGITDTDGVFIVPYAMDESSPDVLWTGGQRPWRTTNGATSWQVVGPNFSGPGRISAIATAPSDSNVVYLGFDNGYVVRTTNALDASPAWQIFTQGLFGGWVSSLAVDPDDPDTAYLTYSTFNIPHVLRTTNGGTSWQSIDGIEHDGVPDIPAHWIAVRPCDPQQLFVGTELGVFLSDDGGTTWAPVNEGLANVVVETLDFKTHHTLVAFTHGRGAFLSELDTCVACPGDVTGNGIVDFADLLSILSAWGPCASCREDVDDDGVVAFYDILILLAGWGVCP